MTATIIHGNNLDILPKLDDCSIDAIVTDPPYELGFMGKRWDASGIAYNVTLWQECLRVLKPGGHLLAFGGTRTYHRMACAIEDAGFEIRDSIHWLYGSGFPKSLDVSKAIDKRGGNVAGFEQFRDAVKEAMERNGVSRSALTKALGNHMLSHYLTAGSQPAVPNARDYRIIRDTVGLGNYWDDLFLDEAEREIIGRGLSGVATAFGDGRWATAEEREQSDKKDFDITAPATDAAKQWAGWGTALKPAHEPIVVARKPLVGTVASNVLEYGTGAINIDASRIPSDDGFEKAWDNPVTTNIGAIPQNFGIGIGDGITHKVDLSGNRPVGGRWPANVIIDDTIANSHDDWPRYFYCAKPSRKERNAGLNHLPERNKYKAGGVGGTGGMRSLEDAVNATPVANHHPTVKPLALMRYLVRLVTPPGGIVLDPFAGSGTTLMAAILEGFNAIGIEMTDEYLPIIQGRIAWAENEAANTPDQQELDL